jgi:hypothetical protein
MRNVGYFVFPGPSVTIEAMSGLGAAGAASVLTQMHTLPCLIHSLIGGVGSYWAYDLILDLTSPSRQQLWLGGPTGLQFERGNETWFIRGV